MSHPHAVFVSYASADRLAANAVCAALERAGLLCWIAPRDVAPGAFYAESIVQGIDAARVMVLVLSCDAAASPHVIREVERATSKRCAIVTLRIDHSVMPPALEYFLNASHWLQAQLAGLQATLPGLVDAVKRLLAPASAPADSADARPVQFPAASSRGANAGNANSIAVLPFANMSAEPDQEYFSDGLAEEIINLLAQVPNLKVIARTSAFAFRGKEQDIRTIAGALGVTHVLEGSVRRAGNKLRITGQLIHAADGTHLWSERYDRELSDIFAVQDEISAAIVTVLRIKLSTSVAQRYTPNLAAYEAFLKARYLGAKIAPESMQQSQLYFEQASILDPAFALPHIGLGHCWIAANMFGSSPAREAFAAARAEAHKALQIDPALPEAHALLGMLAAMYDRDWIAGERHFDFPQAKQVSFATFRPMYGWYQFLRGNPEQTIELSRRAIEEDPLDVWPRMNLQAALQAAGREAEALEQLDKVLELDDRLVVALVAKAMIHAEMGDLAHGLAIARRAYATAPWYPDIVAVLAGLLHRSGNLAESHSLQQSLHEDGLFHAAPLALFHLLCGDVDQGAHWAQGAIEQHDQSITVYLRFVAAKQLRASQRWPALARLLNIQPLESKENEPCVKSQ